MRLQVTVSSVEYGGRIFAVEAVAYDLDGQPGLNVPNSRERTALKEALASVGQTAGTSVNVTRSAGQQVLSELARGGLQASSQYVAGKAPRGEDYPQSQPSAIIDFKTTVK